MLFRRMWLVLGLVGLMASARSGYAQVSKGNQILIDRGLQLQGLCQDDCYVTLSTYTNLNYTGFHWLNNVNGSGQTTHSSRPEWMGGAPGYLPWGRWAWDETQMPPHLTPYGGDETPYLSQLMAICLGDEWDLNNDTTRTRLVNWFTSVRTNWPNAILFHNSWGSQIGDANLADFYTRAQPDMLCFDTYPWKSVWLADDTAGDPIAGPPTAWYGDLRRYREHARGAGIPLGIYRQTFHAIQNYDHTVFRDPSKSELRLNTSGALAFNVKFFNDFLYNTGAASLFTKTFNGSGDTVISTNGLYSEMADVNQRAINLGKALVRLKPIDEFSATFTTSIMFIRGRFISGGVTNFTPVPNSFLNDPSSAANPALPNPLTYTWWEPGKNDPYMTGFGATNKAAAKNNGLNGDVIIAWFRPLDESFDGPTYSNQVYMMVVNGLTDPTGSAADVMQEIRLDFSNLAGAMTNLVMLDPTTGQLQTNGLPLVSSKRRLTLNLNGGDAALFKFNTGAPFVGITPIAPRLELTVQGPNRNLRIQGAIGSRYQLESATSLPTNNWNVLTNLVLPTSPCTFTDTTVSGSGRFYRAVAIP